MPRIFRATFFWQTLQKVCVAFMLCASLSIFAIGDKLEHMANDYTNIYGVPKATIELVMASLYVAWLSFLSLFCLIVVTKSRRPIWALAAAILAALSLYGLYLIGWTTDTFYMWAPIALTFGIILAILWRRVQDSPDQTNMKRFAGWVGSLLGGGGNGAREEHRGGFGDEQIYDGYEFEVLPPEHEHDDDELEARFRALPLPRGLV